MGDVEARSGLPQSLNWDHQFRQRVTTTNVQSVSYRVTFESRGTPSASQLTVVVLEER